MYKTYLLGKSLKDSTIIACLIIIINCRQNIKLLFKTNWDIQIGFNNYFGLYYVICVTQVLPNIYFHVHCNIIELNNILFMNQYIFVA